ncbi:MAG: DUF4251 domain-containing protein [Odoribacter sp.]
MKTVWLILSLFLFVGSLPVSAQKKNSKEEKAARLEEAFQKTQVLVKSNHFKINIDRVYTQSGQDVSRFNPSGEIIITDSVAKGNLPFFGRAYSLPYGEGGGIEFDGPVKDRSILEKKKKRALIYQFSVAGGNDTYQFNIDIAPSGGCTVNLMSNNRAYISYSGSVSPLEEKDSTHSTH